MGNPILVVSICMGKSIRIQSVKKQQQQPQRTLGQIITTILHVNLVVEIRKVHHKIKKNVLQQGMRL